MRVIVYSYLMGVQAIDQNIFPRGMGKDQSVLLPEVKIVENKWYLIKHVGKTWQLGNNFF